MVEMIAHSTVHSLVEMLLPKALLMGSFALE